MCPSQKLFAFFYLFVLLKAQDSDDRVVNIAVVDYRPSQEPNLTPVEILQGNSLNYIKILEEISNSGTDLYFILFPDETLHYGMDPTQLLEFAVPLLVTGDIPCDNNTLPQFLQDLSCAARQYKTFIILNVIEKQPCDEVYEIYSTNCKLYKHFFYSDTIILTDDGSIYSRKYYKNYMMSENYFDNNWAPIEYSGLPLFPHEDSGTDFYGLFASGDILNTEPALSYLGGFSNFLYPTTLKSELPFLTAIQTQQMFFHGHDVNLVAASANLPNSLGSSGLFQGRDGLIQHNKSVSYEDSVAYIYEFAPKNPAENIPQQPLTDEEIDNLSKARDSLQFDIDETLPNYSYQSLGFGNDSTEVQICSGDDRFCCHFEIEISVDLPATEDTNFYTYHLAAYHGLKNFTKNYQQEVEICSIIACLDTTPTSCGSRFPKYEDISWPITFNKINILALSITHSENKVFFPNSLLSSLTPIHPSSTDFDADTVMGRHANYTLHKSQQKILTFAIYAINGDGYVYDNDYNGNPEETTVSTTSATSTTEAPVTVPDGAVSLNCSIALVIFVILLLNTLF